MPPQHDDLGMISARGTTFKGGDLANIEGRLGAWFGDERWKLEAFRLYDAKLGPDLYCVAYAAAFGDDAERIAKNRETQKRQIGKVLELSCGYQGSVGSFVSMGRVYGMQPAGLVAPVRAAALGEWEFWMQAYAGARDKRGMPPDQWAAIKATVTGWRRAHPGLVQCWWDLQDAAIAAVAYPGSLHDACGGRVRYLAARGFLWCALPSGRLLAYAKPHLVGKREEWVDMPDGTRHDAEEHGDDWEVVRAGLLAAGGQHHERWRKQVHYEGYDGEKRRWGTQALYGGMQFNHVVQGTARDVMVAGMLRAEAAGYAVVLTVHDELLCESPIGHGSAADLERLMTAPEPWLVGCPLAAKAWEGPRYAK